MSKKDELMAIYADHIRTRFEQTPDMEFLNKVVSGLGPAIYNKDAAKVSGSDAKEIQTVKTNFLIKKLGLKDAVELDEALAEVMETYGRSERNKYRAVIYYMLARHFKKEGIYG